jgi:hypothetical protein
VLKKNLDLGETKLTNDCRKMHNGALQFVFLTTVSVIIKWQDAQRTDKLINASEHLSYRVVLEKSHIY